MKILIIGSGGREHVLAWKLQQSKICDTLFIAPGNAGTAEFGRNISIAINDFEAIRQLIIREHIEMVVVGPEEPLVLGIIDFLKSDPNLKNIHLVGPSREAAQLEGSKAFAKAFMQRHNIPTAAYQKFISENYLEGVEFIKKHLLPIVLKADGLASGKGVLICNSYIEAMAELELMLINAKFGDAGRKVVIEEFLKGIEISVFVLTDGNHYILLPEAKDYKRVGEGDTGLNTGGMGAISPLPIFEGALKNKVIQTIIEPTINGLKAEGLQYKGFLFFGLIIKDGEPFVIEYNCRMGDPETQVVIPRLKNDLGEIFIAMTANRLDEIVTETDHRTAAAVVAVSGGYPGEHESGKVILGLTESLPEGSILFQAGTKLDEGDTVTAGGRVFAVTSFGSSISDAVQQSLQVMEILYFEGMVYRSDIGYEFTDTVK